MTILLVSSTPFYQLSVKDIRAVEDWNKALNKNKYLTLILTHLSSTKSDLLLVKLHAYGLGEEALIKPYAKLSQ